MTQAVPNDGGTSMHYLMSLSDLDGLMTAIVEADYRLLGPRKQEHSIIYDDIASVADLPSGWTDHQDAGQYRLERRDDAALFGYAVGPHSWKKYLHPERLKLWQATRNDNAVTVELDKDPRPQKFAFLGVRSCELHAIAIQDKVFLGSLFKDPDYAVRREDALLIAVNCSTAGGTCFCDSMNTGPAVNTVHDLALTEFIDGQGHRFLVSVGSDVGMKMIEPLDLPPAGKTSLEEAEAVIDKTRSQMGRRMNTDGIKALLQTNPDHPRWDEIASRCLSCANCTMVCPTCFCTNTEDVNDLSGLNTERYRNWDSCFNIDFTYIHGGGVRQSGKSRYRQWMTHKLASWVDQFGSSGCVGCGRCITWCPTGIDITAEVSAFHEETKHTESKYEKVEQT